MVKDVDDLAELITQVGPQAAYLSIAEGVLQADHPWQDKVQAAKSDLLDLIAQLLFIGLGELAVQERDHESPIPSTASEKMKTNHVNNNLVIFNFCVDTR